MDLQVKGKLKIKSDLQTFDSGFTKREFVITTAEQYPQDIKLELFKEGTKLIDSSNVGDEINVHFNIRGNEYNGKYYVTLQAWKIEIEAQTSSAPIAPKPLSPGNEEDDLPF